jgi:hypothetical protein
VNRIDTALNLAWALLCVGALVFNWWRERQRTTPATGRVRFLRGLSVFLAVFALFPCISISDDYARTRLQDLDSVAGRHGELREASGNRLLLITQLEETEHIRPVAPFVLTLALCCLLFIPTEQRGTRRSFHWDTPSRAPPAL